MDLSDAGAVPPLLTVLGEGGPRSQEGAACALQKLASHKDAATEIVNGNHLSSFLVALDKGTDKAQVYVTSSLFLLRGVDVIVQEQLLENGKQTYHVNFGSFYCIAACFVKLRVRKHQGGNIFICYSSRRCIRACPKKLAGHSRSTGSSSSCPS